MCGLVVAVIFTQRPDLYNAVFCCAALVLIPALLIAFLMLSAQYFHFKVGNSWKRYIPTLFLLILSLFIADISLKLV